MIAKAEPKLTAKEKSVADKLVKKYVTERSVVSTMLDQVVLAIQNTQPLMANVHSLRWRTKDPEHLRDKIHRKILKCKKAATAFDIDENNLFSKLNDLAGLRILHLRTNQIVAIDRELHSLFRAYRYEVVERAKARTWDDEYRQFYTAAGIDTVDSPKMYTSVHYVISPNMGTAMTCEIQVRTLAEELWGEVDHSMNYPHETPVESCREQIKVLARITSSCSRLVDSIYQTSELAAAVTERKAAK